MIEKSLNVSNSMTWTPTADRKPWIYLDMDQVLADFNKGYEYLTGHYPTHNENYQWDTEWKLVDAVPGFFEALPKMPGADMLVKYVTTRGLPFGVITGVPDQNANMRAQEKIRWLHKHYPELFVIITCASRDKYRYCKPGDILIDDWGKYRQKWIDAGGRWITHKSASESILELRMMLNE